MTIRQTGQVGDWAFVKQAPGLSEGDVVQVTHIGLDGMIAYRESGMVIHHPDTPLCTAYRVLSNAEVNAVPAGSVIVRVAVGSGLHGEEHIVGSGKGYHSTYALKSLPVVVDPKRVELEAVKALLSEAMQFVERTRLDHDDLAAADLMRRMRLAELA